ncbi:MAG TPA: hypothetical protein VLG50_06110 [Candidatus Saccharimonadales bacterium]|nr:hypothetical protein [Candidatus Saccharimonadales bacterium]
MNQGMHTWIATALGMLTAKGIWYWQNPRKIEDRVDVLFLAIDLIPLFMSLALLFYWMC